MARKIKIIAALLALLACASNRVATLAACPHDARGTVAVARDPHECCRAHRAHADAHQQAAESSDAATNDAARVEPYDSNTTGACCCVGQAAQTRLPTISPARNESRDARTLAQRAAPSSQTSDPHLLALAPTQHAPPPASARLHILISVMLI